MKTKKLLIIIIALILILFPYVPISAGGENRGMVDTQISTQEELQKTINGFGREGGVVKLSQDLELGSALYFPLDYPITIDGNGHALTLAPGTDTRHISISADNRHITLKNLRLKGHGPNDIGGGISVNGSVTIDNCVIEQNYAPNGGGIISTNGSVTLRNATKVVNNKGYNYGGGIYISSNGFLLATDSVISDNKASRGGGVYITGGSTGSNSALLEYCELNNNKAATTGNDMVTGGAIATEGSNTEIRLTSCVLKDNYSENSGGAIKAGGHLVLDNCKLKGNKSEYVGGALYLESSSAIKGGEISGNETVECGGAIYADDNAIKLLNINGTEFGGNKAERGMMLTDADMEYEAFKIYKELMEAGSVLFQSCSQPPANHTEYGGQEMPHIFNNYDVNVYTKWPITFHIADATWERRGGGEPYEMHFDTDEKVALDDKPVREGYTFEGWYTEIEAGERVDVDALFLATPLTVYARWSSIDQPPQPEEQQPEPEKKMFTVTWALSGSSETREIKVEQGSKLTEPQVDYAHHKVHGWYIDDGDQVWDFNTDTVERDILLKAYWERVSYPEQ